MGLLSILPSQPAPGNGKGFGRAYRRARQRRGIVAVFAIAMLVIVAGIPGATAAQAQSGSRLCGIVWHEPNTNETLIELYEVGKRHHGLCRLVKDQGRKPDDSQLPAGTTHVPYGSPYPTQGSHFTRSEITMLICEWLPIDLIKDGHWEFYGKGPWPNPVDRYTDICDNMNRSDSSSEINDYWLYSDGSNCLFSGGYNCTWKLHRGARAETEIAWS